MSDTVLLTSVETSPAEESSTGFTVTRISITGEPHAAAIVNAVTANYHRLSGREKPTEEQLRERIGEKVTLVVGGENAFGGGLLVAQEGKLFEGQRGLAILPKGKRTKGYSVRLDRVLDFFDGHVTGQAKAIVDGVRSHYPTLRNLTRERLEELPAQSSNLTLAVFGTYTLPDCQAPDAVWLIGEYSKEDDICDGGVLLVRPEYGFSEHGSCFGRQLLTNRAAGEVVGFEPITFAEGLRLCDVDFDEALRHLFGGAREVAA